MAFWNAKGHLKCHTCHQKLFDKDLDDDEQFDIKVNESDVADTGGALVALMQKLNLRF